MRSATNVSDFGYPRLFMGKQGWEVGEDWRTVYEAKHGRESNLASCRAVNNNPFVEQALTWNKANSSLPARDASPVLLEE